MARTVNLIVTCTNRKRAPVLPALRLRSVPGATVEARAAVWFERLEGQEARRVPAFDLYSGDHWHVARLLPREAEGSGWNVQLWICSAGYGLVPLGADLQPYSATFTPENPDCVRRLGGELREAEIAEAWWTALASWPGPKPGAPRRIADLAAEQPGTPILVVASPRYLGAIARDLRSAAKALRQREQLSIFSAGASGLDGLEEHLIPCDARLQAVVRGARFSLSARAARLALTGDTASPLRAPELRAWFNCLLADQPEPARWEREEQSDDQVERFIREALLSEPKARTPLLRDLRALGRACEQGRFAGFYRKIYEEIFGAPA